jgi:hypothetical protein
MASIQRDLEEGDAKNRLYQLLLERTKREHMSVDQKVGRRERRHSKQWSPNTTHLPGGLIPLHCVHRRTLDVAFPPHVA